VRTQLKACLSLAQRAVPAARHGDLVLAYHLIGGGTDSPVDVSIDQFKRQLDRLGERFDFVPLSQIRTSQPIPGSNRRPRVVLTFDDAYANFARVAWPLLSARRIPAILYVPVGFVRGSAPPPLRGASLPACTFAELRELATSGLELGSHGVNHVNLRRVNDATLAAELKESREVLEQELGRAVPSFCYPQAKLDARGERATARHYDNAVAAGGRRHLGRHPFRIPRFPVRRDEPNFDAMLESSVWLTEAISNGVRQWRR
jgi:hypothetical protein